MSFLQLSVCVGACICLFVFFYYYYCLLVYARVLVRDLRQRAVFDCSLFPLGISVSRLSKKYSTNEISDAKASL